MISTRFLLLSSLMAVALGLLACSVSTVDDEPAIRLVDDFDQVSLEFKLPETEPPARTEWNYKETEISTPAGWSDWRAASGVTDLAVSEGALHGKTTDTVPLVYLEHNSALETDDFLHAVEVRLRATSGANLAVMFSNDEEFNLEAIKGQIRLFPWSATPIVAGEEYQTYQLTSPFPQFGAGTRHIVISPTDAPGADFEIESLRLIFRQEHLAQFPTGVGWQGLGEIFRETLVARAPESLSWEVDLPGRPFLDLVLGTPQEAPVTFKVRVDQGGASGSESTLEVERTISQGDQWEPMQVDLADHAGQTVRLSLTLEAEEEGTIGFWGAPTIRNRGAMPRREATADNGSTIEPPQGVIIVLVDTLRTDHLDAYGYERQTAPNLTELASTGVLFSNTYAQGTWTKVSATSLLTSLYPSTHGVSQFADRIPASVTTLAEVFRDAGYATLSFSSVLFTGKFTNLHQGYEAVHEFTSAGGLGNSKTAQIYIDRLLPWLETHRDVPFFVQLHLFDPHDPYEPNAPYNTRWFDASIRAEHLEEIEAVKPFIDDPIRRAFEMPNRAELEMAELDADRFIDRQIDWYDGSIRGFDTELGRLLERLAELGLREDTLVVFVGDHGEEFLEHGQMFHGQTVYGELSHVPFIASWPGAIPAGGVVDEPVQLIDVFPTLLSLSGLAIPEAAQGQSLAPYLLAEIEAPHRPRPVLTEQAAIPSGSGNPPPADKESYSLVWEGRKLIHNRQGAGDLPEFELYDPEADPLDLNNLAESEPETVGQLTKVLDGLLARAIEARIAEDDGSAESMSPEELEKLRALGYIE